MLTHNSPLRLLLGAPGFVFSTMGLLILLLTILREKHISQLDNVRAVDLTLDSRQQNDRPTDHQKGASPLFFVSFLLHLGLLHRPFIHSFLHSFNQSLIHLSRFPLERWFNPFNLPSSFHGVAHRSFSYNSPSRKSTVPVVPENDKTSQAISNHGRSRGVLFRRDCHASNRHPTTSALPVTGAGRSALVICATIPSNAGQPMGLDISR